MQLDVVKLWLSQQLQSQHPARELRIVDNDFINTCIRAQLASKQHNTHAAQAFSATTKAYQGDSKLNHWSSHMSGLVGNLLDVNLSGDVHIRQQQKIESALVDTGANATLMFTSREEHMSNPKESNLSIYKCQILTQTCTVQKTASFTCSFWGQRSNQNIQLSVQK